MNKLIVRYTYALIGITAIGVFIIILSYLILFVVSFIYYYITGSPLYLTFSNSLKLTLFISYLLSILNVKK